MNTAFDVLRQITPHLSFSGGIKAKTPAPDDDYWYKSIFGNASSTGLNVTPESAMRVAAVFACVKVIAETVGSLPFITYKRLGNGGKERDAGHYLYELLRYQPNQTMTSAEFWEMMVGHLLLRGNAYAHIVPGKNGFVQELIPLHPDRLRVERLANGRLRYKYNDPNDNGREKVFVQDELLRLMGLSSDGMQGLSVIKHACEPVGLAMATEAYGARFFKNNAQPGGILEHPAHFKDQASFERFKEHWHSQFTGENQHKTAILEDGMTWKQIAMTSEDAQYLETRKFQVSEICRIFRVPPHMIADLEKATFSNIEHQSIDFVVHTIRPWVTKIEQAVRRDLVLDKENTVCEFLVDGLLRGDAKTRSEYYAKALGSGGSSPWMTVNEIRERENLNPLEGGDELKEPINRQVETKTPNEDADER